MTKYLGILVHGVSGGEGRYEFEGPDDLLRKRPVRIIRAFMYILSDPEIRADA